MRAPQHLHVELRHAVPRTCNASHALRSARVWNVEAGGTRFAVGPLPKFGQAGFVAGFMGTMTTLCVQTIAAQAFLSFAGRLET
jgi:hypothetical protein